MDIDGQTRRMPPDGQSNGGSLEIPGSQVPQRTTSGSDKARRRRRLLEAQEFCQDISLGNPRTRYRYREGMQLGTLPPPIEKALLDIGYGPGQSLDKRLLDALGQTGRGLTLLLRKALTEDPLAEPKKVDARVIIDQPQQEPDVPVALPPRSSIVPPARPSKKTRGTGTLKPGEEELDG